MHGDGAISDNNIVKRVLPPFPNRRGFAKAGLHAFWHSRLTMLRKNGRPEDLHNERTERRVKAHRGEVPAESVVQFSPG